MDARIAAARGAYKLLFFCNKLDSLHSTSDDDDDDETRPALLVAVVVLTPSALFNFGGGGGAVSRAPLRRLIFALKM